MPIVGIPSLLRELTGGKSSLTVHGNTVREVIENLEALHPGIKERLCDGEHLRPSISVVVDGETSTLKLRHQLDEASEVYFVIAISGGMLCYNGRTLLKNQDRSSRSSRQRAGRARWKPCEAPAGAPEIP